MYHETIYNFLKHLDDKITHKIYHSKYSDVFYMHAHMADNYFITDMIC